MTRPGRPPNVRTSLERPIPTACVLILTTVAVLSPIPVRAQEPQLAPEAEVVERARTAAPIRELYAVHTEAEPAVAFSDRYNCWVVEFLADGREVGFATVSPDAGRVLEASFRAPEPEEDEAEGDGLGGRGRSPLTDLLDRLRPRFEGGALFWLAAVVLLLTFWDFGHPARWRNADVLSLLLLAPFLAILWDHTRSAFRGIAAVTVYYLGRSLVAAWRPPPGPITTNLGVRPLAVLLALAFLLHLDVIARRGVDDCGIWGTFGAQHLLAHGRMPYGAEDFGGGDTYGPLFYALHVPFVLIWPPGYEANGAFHVIREGLPEDVGYERLSFTAAKLVAGIADALILLGLARIGRRRGGLRLGLGLAVAYGVLPYTIDGLNFSSHIVPTACTVWRWPGSTARCSPGRPWPWASARCSTRCSCCPCGFPITGAAIGSASAGPSLRSGWPASA